MPNTSKKKKSYSVTDLRSVCDSPKWTRKDFAKAKRFEDAFPDLARTIRHRGKQRVPTKKALNARG